MKKRLLGLSPYLLYLALTLPGLHKAFHVDDAYFLTWARHVQQQPLRPVDFSMDWHGVHVPVGVLANPPLHAYVLAGLSALVGEREAPLHAVMVAFGLLGLAAAGVLAARFDVNPLAARLLVAVSPALVVLSQTVMPDVVAFALGCVGLALGFDAVDRDRPWRGLASGLALAAASLTRYTALGLIAPLFAHALAARRRLLSAGTALVVVVAAMLSWVAILRSSGGPTHLSGLFTPGVAADPAALGGKLAATAALLGGTLVVPPLLAGFLPRLGRQRVMAMVAATTAGLVVALAASRRLGGGSLLLLGLLAGCGSLVLAWVGARLLLGARRWWTRQPDDGADLTLGLWIVAPLMVPMTYQHVAAKYLLPVLPALVILLLRRGTVGRRLLAVGVAGGFTLSFACAMADRQHAELARRVAREVAAPLLARAPVVWSAPEWGYRTYLSRLGARTLTRGSHPAPGDLVLVAETTPPFDLPQLMGLHVEERARHALTTDFPLVLMNRAAGAGFYSSVWGWLPYAWSRPLVAMDMLTVYEVLDASRPGLGAGPTPGPRE